MTSLNWILVPLNESSEVPVERFDWWSPLSRQEGSFGKFLALQGDSVDMTLYVCMVQHITNSVLGTHGQEFVPKLKGSSKQWTCTAAVGHCHSQRLKRCWHTGPCHTTEMHGKRVSETEWWEERRTRTDERDSHREVETDVREIAAMTQKTKQWVCVVRKLYKWWTPSESGC